MAAIPPDARLVVEQQRLGFVATVNEDGTPNLSPKGTVAVFDDDHLVFADIRSPGTIRNLRVRPAIEINVVDPIGRMGYRFRGTATVVDGGDELARLLAFYRERGTDLPIRAVVLIRVERPERAEGGQRASSGISPRRRPVAPYGSRVSASSGSLERTGPTGGGAAAPRSRPHAGSRRPRART